MRYVPLTALHDGSQWLVEQFQVNYITAASDNSFSGKPIIDPEIIKKSFVLAGAVTEGQNEVNVEERTYAFPPLEGTDIEVREIERLATLPEQAIVRIEPDFLLDSISDMKGFDIAHFATHAQFEPDRPELSIILFSDGDYITLEQFDAELSNSSASTALQLLVLSACQTASGSAIREGTELDGDGEEILSFGFIAQKSGIDATISSLWEVSDGGTAILMSAFYQAMLDKGMAPTRALTAAQRLMINSENSLLDVDRDALIQGLIDQGLPNVQERVNKLNDPFYWAPFILTGNGLWF